MEVPTIALRWIMTRGTPILGNLDIWVWQNAISNSNSDILIHIDHFQHENLVIWCYLWVYSLFSDTANVYSFFVAKGLVRKTSALRQAEKKRTIFDEFWRKGCKEPGINSWGLTHSDGFLRLCKICKSEEPGHSTWLGKPTSHKWHHKWHLVGH